ncbi:MAG: hypothetical protein IKT65_05755 [Clostridia bacterium]|nr:hypothetical protein [Clostridia bacterium]
MYSNAFLYEYSSEYELPAIWVNSHFEITEYNAAFAELFGSCATGTAVTVHALSAVSDERFPYTAILELFGNKYICCISNTRNGSVIYFSIEEKYRLCGLIFARYAIESKKCELFRRADVKMRETNASEYAHCLHMLATCLEMFPSNPHTALKNEDTHRLAEYTVRRFKALKPSAKDITFRFHCFESADEISIQVAPLIVCLIISAMSFSKSNITLLIERTVYEYIFHFEFDETDLEFDYMNYGYAGWVLDKAATSNYWKITQTKNTDKYSVCTTFRVPASNDKYTLHAHSRHFDTNDFIALCLESFLGESSDIV